MTDYSVLDAALADLSHAEADALGRSAFITARASADHGELRRSAFWHGLGCAVLDAADARRTANKHSRDCPGRRSRNRVPMA